MREAENHLVAIVDESQDAIPAAYFIDSQNQIYPDTNSLRFFDFLHTVGGNHYQRQNYNDRAPSSRWILRGAIRHDTPLCSRRKILESPLKAKFCKLENQYGEHIARRLLEGRLQVHLLLCKSNDEDYDFAMQEDTKLFLAKGLQHVQKKGGNVFAYVIDNSNALLFRTANERFMLDNIKIEWPLDSSEEIDKIVQFLSFSKNKKQRESALTKLFDAQYYPDNELALLSEDDEAQFDSVQNDDHTSVVFSTDELVTLGLAKSFSNHDELLDQFLAHTGIHDTGKLRKIVDGFFSTPLSTQDKILLTHSPAT